MRPEEWVGPDMHGSMGRGRRLCIYPKNSFRRFFKEKKLGDWLQCEIHLEENWTMCRYQLSWDNSQAGSTGSLYQGGSEDGQRKRDSRNTEDIYKPHLILDCIWRMRERCQGWFPVQSCPFAEMGDIGEAQVCMERWWFRFGAWFRIWNNREELSGTFGWVCLSCLLLYSSRIW